MPDSAAPKIRRHHRNDWEVAVEGLNDPVNVVVTDASGTPQIFVDNAAALNEGDDTGLTFEECDSLANALSEARVRAENLMADPDIA